MMIIIIMSVFTVLVYKIKEISEGESVCANYKVLWIMIIGAMLAHPQFIQ